MTERKVLWVDGRTQVYSLYLNESDTVVRVSPPRINLNKMFLGRQLPEVLGIIEKFKKYKPVTTKLVVL